MKKSQLLSAIAEKEAKPNVIASTNETFQSYQEGKKEDILINKNWKKIDYINRCPDYMMANSFVLG